MFFVVSDFINNGLGFVFRFKFKSLLNGSVRLPGRRNRREEFSTIAVIFPAFSERSSGLVSNTYATPVE